MLGNDAMHRLIGIEEARPGHLCDFVGQGCWTEAAIELVIAVPEWKPLREVFARDGTDDWSGHIFSSICSSQPPAIEGMTSTSSPSWKAYFSLPRKRISSSLT